MFEGLMWNACMKIKTHTITGIKAETTTQVSYLSLFTVIYTEQALICSVNFARDNYLNQRIVPQSLHVVFSKSQRTVEIVCSKQLKITIVFTYVVLRLMYM
jgi:hypothetical protein